MSLNSVVNNLVRAAASIPVDISDADLDRHVAALLAEEAKAREVKWSELGLGAWTGSTGRDSPDPNAPKPNKRFLAAVIKNVAGHNRDLLRSQAEAARDIRRSRGEEDLRGSSSRRIGGGRLFGGAMAGLAQNRSRKGKEREGESGHVRDWEERYFSREGEGGRTERLERRGSYERENERRSRRYEEESHDRRKRERSRDRGRAREEDDRDRRKRRDRSSDPDDHQRRRREREEDDRDRRRRHRSPKEERDRMKERRDERERAEKKARDKRYENYPDSEEDQTIPSTTRNGHSHSHDSGRKSNGKHASPPPPPPVESPPPSPSPPPMPSPISKMDKYFNTAYDPRLDLGEVPREGMIVNVGWDNMLAVLKERGKKRRLQSPGLSPDPYDIPAGLSIRSPSPDILSRKVDKSERRKRKEDRKRRKGADSDESEDEREKRRERKRKEKEREAHLAPSAGGSTNGEVLGMEYIKKGGTREWDKGK